MVPGTELEFLLASSGMGFVANRAVKLRGSIGVRVDWNTGHFSW
jgi:hypothetical protein